MRKKFGLEASGRLLQFANSSKPSTVVFVANSGQIMASNGFTVNLDTLHAPLEGGGVKLVKELTDGDVLSLPFMIDHGYRLEHVAGSITKLSIQDEGLVATGVLGNTDAGELVRQHLIDGSLHNNFSVGVAFSSDDLDKNKLIINNGELVEISAVYTGADERTKVLEFFSKKGIDVNSFGTPPANQQPLNFSSPQQPNGNMVLTAQNKNKPLARQNGGGLAYTQPQGGQTWLDSYEAVAEFFNLRKDWNINKQNREDFAKRWQQHLRDRNLLRADSSSIQNPSDLSPFIPQPIVTAIIDQYNEADPVWALVRKTGLYRATVMEQNVGLFSENGRAHGHTRGTEKQIEELSFRSRVISPTYIYKMLRIDQKDLREAEQNPGNAGLFFNYLMTELLNRIFSTIGYSIIFDDFTDIYNTTDNSGFLSIEAMAADTSSTWPGNEFALTVDGDDVRFANDDLPDTLWNRLRLASSRVKAPGDKVLVCNDETIAMLAMQTNDNGTPIFGTAPTYDQIRASLGVERIITPSWWGEEQDETMVGCVFVPSQYGVVGSTTVEEFSDFNLKYNQYEFLNEVYVGGGLLYPKSACIVKPFDSES